MEISATATIEIKGPIPNGSFIDAYYHVFKAELLLLQMSYRQAGIAADISHCYVNNEIDLHLTRYVDEDEIDNSPIACIDQDLESTLESRLYDLCSIMTVKKRNFGITIKTEISADALEYDAKVYERGI